MFRSRQEGLTLVELLISVVILGILMVVIGPIFASALTFMESAKKGEVQLNNQKLGAGMLSYARNNNGNLPPAHPSKGYALYDKEAADGDLTSEDYRLFLELTGAGVPPNQINSAGYGVDALKRYQLVTGLTSKQKIFFNTGDEVTLNYQVGVIYQSDCAKSLCLDTDPFAGSEVKTEKLTASNIASWELKGSDYAPVMINTLSEQKAMLRTTLGRINRLSDRISSHYYATARVSEDASKNNFAGDNATQVSPSVNGCWVAWDDLSSNASNMLPSIGLNKNEYGKTAWGGKIEYCRDYKPNGLGGVPPFYAALRINRDLKFGSNPDPYNNNKNIVITF